VTQRRRGKTSTAAPTTPTPKPSSDEEEIDVPDPKDFFNEPVTQTKAPTAKLNPLIKMLGCAILLSKQKCERLSLKEAAENKDKAEGALAQEEAKQSQLTKNPYSKYQNVCKAEFQLICAFIKTIYHVKVTHRQQSYVRSPNKCVKEIGLKGTNISIPELAEVGGVVPDPTNFFNVRDFDSDHFKVDCSNPAAAVTTLCQLLTFSPASCEHVPSYAYKATVKLKRGAAAGTVTHCIKIKPVSGRYRYWIRPIEANGPCTINNGMRRRRLLQDDTGSSGC
jgi:hypothetical protein